MKKNAALIKKRREYVKNRLKGVKNARTEYSRLSNELFLCEKTIERIHKA